MLFCAAGSCIPATVRPAATSGMERDFAASEPLCASLLPLRLCVNPLPSIIDLPPTKAYLPTRPARQRTIGAA